MFEAAVAEGTPSLAHTAIQDGHRYDFLVDIQVFGQQIAYVHRDNVPFFYCTSHTLPLFGQRPEGFAITYDYYGESRWLTEQFVGGIFFRQLLTTVGPPVACVSNQPMTAGGVTFADGVPGRGAYVAP